MRASKSKTFHHGNLRAALVASATTMLEEQGPDGVSLRGAARMSGVSQTAPYRHFENKEALLAAISEAGFVAMTQTTQRAYRKHAHQPLAALEAASKAYVRFALRHRSQYRLMFGTAVRGSRHPGLRAAAVAAMNVIVCGIRQCQDARLMRKGNPLHQAVVMWSLLHGLTSSFVDEQLPAELRSSMAADRITSYAMRSLLDGLSTRT